MDIHEYSLFKSIFAPPFCYMQMLTSNMLNIQQKPSNQVYELGNIWKQRKPYRNFSLGMNQNIIVICGKCRGAGSIIYSVLSDKPWYSNIIDLNFPVFVFTSNILPTWHMEMLKCLIKIKFGLIIANFSKSLSETRKNVIISPNKLNKQ